MTPKILLKACPRCRGDLYGGLDGEFSCLQCGYELSAASVTELVEKLDAKEKRLVGEAA